MSATAVAILVIIGITVAVELSTAVIVSFRDTVSVGQVGLISGVGKYSGLELSSTGISQIYSKKKVDKVINIYLDEVLEYLPARFGNRTEEVVSAMREMADFGGYGCSSQTYFVSYDNSTSKMRLFMYNFAPISETQFRARLLSCSMQFKMPGSYAIMATTRKNTWRTSVTQSLEYIPPEITQQAVVDSIALMLAPVLTDYDIPEDIKSDIEAAAELVPPEDLKISQFVQ